LKSFLVFLKRIPEYPKTEIDNIIDDDYCTRVLNSI